ncbi:MAG: alanine--tRNA ligase [Deltaproteobacteria bacterium]|nr:alanine--tRNA ligase [Deltaproteobacteria bacterium]
MTGNEIRRKFLEYFQRRGHTVVASSSLVPQKDPTLLFTNAGMVQFKAYFTGEEQAPFPRATSSQKCVRAGGKHNDLENVGYTARHHTFFEMLGNFSFGDYFKEEAISMGWEFLTATLRLPPEKLWVTIHEGDPELGLGPDEEARKIWRRFVPPERIRLFPTKDNFWQMGETGPCGPCSEIVIDQGPQVGCRRPECDLGCDCDRFLELWNLVFMQFERHPDGRLTPLPRPSIDTGMGLERIAAVVQGVESNYEADLFRGILHRIEEIAGRPYLSSEPAGVSFRVIADHSRAATFLIGDGVLPSNEGRGYVLRRIMRRAMRHGRKLGIREPFLFPLTEEVVRVMHEAYPELAGSQETVRMVISNEEERFSDTLNTGLRLWAEERQKLKEAGESKVPGELIFKLYDTYGFPLDLTEEMARDEGFVLGREGFEEAMGAQRARAREAWKGSGDEALREVYKALAGQNLKTEFVGYDDLESRGRVLRILKGEGEVEGANEGDEVEVITDRTPFYGEAGGQVGDRGVLRRNGFWMEVLAATRPLPEVIAHRGVIRQGKLRVGDLLELQVDGQNRQRITLNHTATHVLQAALRQVLGSHVQQAGSLVAPDRLRFDFTHFSPLSEEEIDRVEEMVNVSIRQNLEVKATVLPYREALAQGAIALFGEKYGNRVRMVRIGPISTELCGGTHSHHSGDIGLFKILSETGVAAGVRRIEAVTGEEAWKAVKREERELREAALLLKGKPGEVAERIKRLLLQQKEMERSLRALQDRISAGRSRELAAASRTVNGVQVLSTRVEAKDPKALREMADRLKEQIQSGIILLGATADDKALLLCAVTPDLAGKYPAQELIKEVARYVAGRGGGRPDLAQAGGPRKEGLDQALEKIYELIERQ